LAEALVIGHVDTVVAAGIFSASKMRTAWAGFSAAA
jgi:hypothetical protein